jgi:hypothetical protein
MMYAPHILQIKVNAEDAVDDNGHPIISDETEQWNTVCLCRCDDNDTKEFKTDNGGVYRPNYHIVSENNSIKADDEIRCLDADGNVRGSGRVYSVKNTNYFNYTEIWV